MPYRDLCELFAALKTRGMRFPPCRVASSSIPSLGRFFLLLVLLALPSWVEGTTRQLQSSPASLNFGVVPVGQKQAQLIAVKNTGQTTVTISGIRVSATEFTVSGVKLPALLRPGQILNLRVSFSPPVIGWLGGIFTVTSNASNPNLRIQVQGDGVRRDPISPLPASVRFSKVPVGQSSSHSVVLTNTSPFSLTLTTFKTIGSEFTVRGPAVPYVLVAGQSTKLTIRFAPQAAGLRGGSVFIAGPNLNIPFAGTGTAVGQLAISPATLNFGNVDIGVSGSQTSILSAIGGDVTVTSATSSNSQYVVAGATFPMVIRAGQSANLSLVFSPTQGGTDSAILSVSSNASNTLATEGLTGVGVSPLYTVSLAWDASTSPVVGYNVYRRAGGSSYSKINSSLDPSTAYTDATVTAGATYYYAATAVNSSGQESKYSTPVKVAIP